MISVKLIMILADNDAANGSVDGEFVFVDDYDVVVKIVLVGNITCR